MKKTLAIVLVASLSASAELEVSKIFGSNMVLQRGVPVPVWGKAAPEEEIRVSFAGQTHTVRADAEGEWQVALTPLATSAEGRALEVSGRGTQNVFTNVLVGDVWLCSGQSNMEMPFSWGVYGGDDFQAEAERFPTIRHAKIKNVSRPGEEFLEVPLEKAWTPAAEAFPNVTAAGYFFARRLSLELKIPIGIVNASQSGSKIEPFISTEGFHLVPRLSSLARKLDEHDPRTEKGYRELTNTIASVRRWADGIDADREAGRLPEQGGPSLQVTAPHGVGPMTERYNGMIHPIIRFPIKGVIWYQGCSNNPDGASYADKMEALVLGWRKAWGYDFPFYYVQLASFKPNARETAEGGTGYAVLRDAQRKVLERLPNVGMAVAIDVGDPGRIHPKAKLFVGERLALWALAKDYGKDVVFSGPLVKGAVVETDVSGTTRVRVSFDYVGSGLMCGKKDWENNDPVEEDVKANGKVRGFSLQNADGSWHYADAAIDGADVVVSSPGAPKPTAVRYAFRACPLGECGLYTREKRPASPFSLDLAKPDGKDSAKE